MSWFTRKKDKEAEEQRNCQHQQQQIPESPEAESLTFLSLLRKASSTRSLSAVYACIEIISNAVASMPLRVMSEDVSGHRTLVPHHPLQRIFRSKNYQRIGMFQTIKSVVTDVLVKGNGYIYINRAGDSDLITSLKYVPAGDVTIMYDEQKDTLYYLIQKLKGSKPVMPKDIIHIVKNTREGVSGVSVMTYAQEVVELAKAAEASAKEFFESGMNINGILSCGTMLNDKQRQDIRNSWTMGGGKTSLQILPANVSYQQIGTDATKAQLLESRQYEGMEIARYFCVPPQLIQSGEKLTYNNLEQLNLLFLQYCLMPYLISIEEEFTRKIFPEDDELIVDFDESEFVLRTDKQSTATYLTSLVSNGIMTVNEARRELGLSQVEGGDTLHIAYSDAAQNEIN